MRDRPRVVHLASPCLPHGPSPFARGARHLTASRPSPGKDVLNQACETQSVSASSRPSKESVALWCSKSQRENCPLALQNGTESNDRECTQETTVGKTEHALKLVAPGKLVLHNDTDLRQMRLIQLGNSHPHKNLRLPGDMPSPHDAAPSASLSAPL